MHLFAMFDGDTALNVGTVLRTSTAHTIDAWVYDSRVLAFKNYSRLSSGCACSSGHIPAGHTFDVCSRVGSADFKFCDCCYDSSCFSFRLLLIY